MATIYLVICTTNQGKRKEWEALLQGMDMRVLTLKDAGLENLTVINENALTFSDNAAIKARAYVQAYGQTLNSRGDGTYWLLTEDSGIVVQAMAGTEVEIDGENVPLDQWPGVRSARWHKGTDGARNAEMLRRMDGVENRTAGYVAAVCIMDCNGNQIWTGEATCKGVLLTEARGDGGFGYDPILSFDGTRAVAELRTDEKATHSHRGEVGRDFAAWLLSQSN